MAKPEALVFDLDGTLIDSHGDIVAALNHALIHTGRAPLSAEIIATYVGDGSRLLCARASSLDPEDPALTPLFDAFLAYYNEHPATHTKPMPHALEALEALSAYPLALCTNKPRSTTDLVLKALDWEKYFVTTMAGGDTQERKPHPEPLLLIAKKIGTLPSRLVMIGDGPQDIEAGRRAGARTVGIRGGFPAIEDLLRARPDVVLDSLAELAAVIERWE